ncbi:MAG: NAD(P)-binding protein, partial [Pseudomonadota bacterium]|nr:NAD(P)-binding protein [Pseudomonadota bacterium]
MPSVIPPDNIPENSTEIVIIGSGLAGLAAGQLLREAGHNALILDKGRRAGGRMSTRRADGFLFNHGAQFVTARSAAFSAVCARAVQAGQLAKWPLAGREDAFSGTPAMRGLAEFMAEGLTIRQQAEVKNITRVKPSPGPHNGPLK